MYISAVTTISNSMVLKTQLLLRMNSLKIVSSWLSLAKLGPSLFAICCQIPKLFTLRIDSNLSAYTPLFHWTQYNWKIFSTHKRDLSSQQIVSLHGILTEVTLLVSGIFFTKKKCLRVNNKTPLSKKLLENY